MIKSLYQKLDWDTNFFGFLVAKIQPITLSPLELRQQLTTLREQGVRLVYWATPNASSQTMAEAAGGRLVDKKVTYRIDLTTLPLGQAQNSPVVEYTALTVSEDLIQLAIQAGLYSRFRIDPQMDQKKFRELYTLWVVNSCNKKLAQAVLVIRDHERCVAMVTVGEKNGYGDIGLVAVAASQRGKGYGQKLIRAVQTWFVQHGYTTSQVVTQGDNIAACKLYEKCGYTQASLEYYYHFWL